MNHDTRLQQASIKWGGVESYSFQPTGTSITVSQTLSQLCKLECSRPRVWHIIVTVDLVGFDAETNPLTVTLQATPATGRGASTIFTAIPIAAPYAQYQDAGFLSGSVQLAAKVTGGPFTSTALHTVNVAVAAAPWTTDEDRIVDELRLVRGELAALRGILTGGR